MTGDVYAAPPSARPALGWAAVYTGALAALWLALLTLLVVWAPGYGRTYRDFGLMLPGYSQVVLGVSVWMTNYWYVLAPVLVLGLAAMGAVLFTLLCSDATRRWAHLLAWAHLLLLLLVLPAVVLAVYLPYVKLMEGLSK